jgi:hypothetical protein
MSSSHDDSFLRGKFFALRRHMANNAEGFVCILDLRRSQKDRVAFSFGQLLAVAALIAFAVLIVNACLAEQSEQTPSLPDARPRSDRFRSGGRGSKFLLMQCHPED